jgi:hypothetical protein
MQDAMSHSITSSPPHPFTSSSALCPLCLEAIDLEQPLPRLSAEWREVLACRDRWADVAETFRNLESIEATAEATRLAPELVEQILYFLCLEICGCRRFTCPACLDDYRSAL